MNPPDEPRGTLMRLRIIWAGILMGPAVFAVVVFSLISSESAAEPLDAPSSRLLFLIACIMTVTLIPIGLFVRGQVFKRNWQGDVITPGGYATGNIIAFAACEAPIFLSLIVCLSARAFWPYVIPAAVCFAALLMQFPNGRAMFPPTAKDADSDNPYRPVR